MELVLSPGNLGGEDGGPFRNEDVREWSRIDRITGMLERARVETGRWRANTRDAAQSYGKMIDSRERNSADGSLIQKARRQVEIFQSQGNGGRSFQVVRASQWSSSRATDCVFDVPIAKPSSTHRYLEDATSGGFGAEARGPLRSTRASLWPPSPSRSVDDDDDDDADDAGHSDLERLSQLCRRLHNEALASSAAGGLWSLRGPRSPSPPTLGPGLLPLPTEAKRPLGSSERLAARRSNSSEELAGCADEGFARDCRTRRSLQIPAGDEALSADDGRGSRTRTRQELIAERARRFEHGAGGDEDGSARRSFAGAKSFASIADNDFVRNDPRHPSKLGQQTARFGIRESAPPSSQTTQPQSPVPAVRPSRIEPTPATTSSSSSSPSASPPSSRVVAPPTPLARKVSNRTVVHLRNAASPSAVDVGVGVESGPTAPRRRQLDFGGAVEPTENGEAESRRDGGEPGPAGGHYGMLMDARSREEPPPSPTTSANGSRPVKRVEFCKTEIHFAPDTGKVNIVETDGKPPPTNKFRRRRRNGGPGSNGCGAQKGGGMPLVHFGDTSYEKYIFGGAKAAGGDHGRRCDTPPPQPSPGGEPELAATAKEKWESPLARETPARSASPTTGIRSAREPTEHHGPARLRGAHTTTVNILNDEGGQPTASARSTEGVPHPRAVVAAVGRPRIRLRFAASNRGLSPLASDEEDGAVSRTTKITVHLRPSSAPATALVGHRHGYAQQQAAGLELIGPLASLESVKLVMRIGRMGCCAPGVAAGGGAAGLSLERLFSSLCSGTEEDGMTGGGGGGGGAPGGDPGRWSLLRLESADDGADRRGTKSVEERAVAITDKSIGTFPPPKRASRDEVGSSPERLPSDRRVASKDSDNNEVLLKIVTAHKPLLARVDSVRSSIGPLLKPWSRIQTDDALFGPVDLSAVLGSKATAAPSDDPDCPSARRDSGEQVALGRFEAPTYENVFGAAGGEAPLYENFGRAKDAGARAANEDRPKPLGVGRPSRAGKAAKAPSARADKVLGTSTQERRQRIGLAPRLGNGSLGRESSTAEGKSSGKQRATERTKAASRSVTPMSSLSSARSDRSSVQPVRANRASGATAAAAAAGSRDGSAKRSKDGTKEAAHQQPRGRASPRVNGSAEARQEQQQQQHRQQNKVQSSLQKNRGTARSKKPVEVVYQTAIYNMKNEKLSKPTKTKEVKGPRLLNDLICGSKLRRPSANKKIAKTAILSQNTSKRKETPAKLINN